MSSFIITSSSENDTARIAGTLAPLLYQSDIILFKGDLASGKTFFIKALATQLGIKDLVTSPTYTLANFYRAEFCKLLHIDVYRLKNQEEFWDLGLDDFYDESITVIEWGDMVRTEFQEYLLIELNKDPDLENTRLIRFSPYGIRWENKLRSFQNIIQES